MYGVPGWATTSHLSPIKPSPAEPAHPPSNPTPHTTYHCRANCSGVRGRQTEMITQKAIESRPTKTAPGCLHKRENHNEEPLPPFLAFLRDATAAGGGTLLGRAMARILCLEGVVGVVVSDRDVGSRAANLRIHGRGSRRAMPQRFCLCMCPWCFDHRTARHDRWCDKCI